MAGIPAENNKKKKTILRVIETDIILENLDFEIPQAYRRMILINDQVYVNYILNYIIFNYIINILNYIIFYLVN